MLCFVFRPVFASGLADRVQEAYRDARSFQADFVQRTHVEVLERDVEERGELTFVKPGKLVIHYGGARERKYVSNGSTLWIYHPQAKEVEVFNRVGDLLSREALAFLGGLGQMTKDFLVKGESGHQLTLVPRRNAAPFNKLILKVDPQDHLVREAILFPRGGNQSHYVFSSVKTNGDVPAASFHFQTKGLKVVEPLEP